MFSKNLQYNRLLIPTAHILPGLLLAALPFCGTDPYVCVAVLTLAYTFNGATTQTSFANCHDLSPNFSATLMTLANALGGLAGFISPTVVTYFTHEVVSVPNANIMRVVIHYCLIDKITCACRTYSRVGATCFCLALVFSLLRHSSSCGWEVPACRCGILQRTRVCRICQKCTTNDQFRF